MKHKHTTNNNDQNIASLKGVGLVRLLSNYKFDTRL